MKLLLMIPIILGFTYCTTTHTTDSNAKNTEITNTIDNEALKLENIRSLIEDGSLDSLNNVIKLIEEGTVSNTEKGSFYKIITLSLIKLVYPYSKNFTATITYPKTGVLAEIVSKAENGEILNISKQNVNFFTLLLSSTAALHTKSDAVLAQSFDILNTIYETNTSSFLSVFIQSFINEEQKSYKDALNGYRRALRIDPLSYPAELGVIRILNRNSDYSESLKHIENIIKDYGNQLEVQYLYVDALIGSDQLSKAANLVASYLAPNPDNMELTLRYADILQREGKNIQASHLLQALESLVGDTSYSLFIKASIMFNNGNYSNAESLLKEAADKYPDDIRIRNLYGRVLLVTGKSGAGREYLEDSFKINPDSMGSLRLLIEEATSSKDWKRAEGYVKTLLLNDDSDMSLRYAVEIYRNLSENQKALDYNNKILKSEHALNNDYLITIKLLLQEGKSFQALKDINSWLTASKTTEDKSYFYYLKSLVLTDPQKKLDSLRQALFENLQNLDAIVAIADVYYKLDDKRNSYRYLKQALILSHDDKKIKEKIRKLEKEM